MATRFETTCLVCLTGPESSGKTTLATQLSGEFAAPMVSEFARDFLQQRGGRYTEETLEHIALGQQAAERRVRQLAANQGNSLVLADTDIQVIETWWWFKYAPSRWQRRYSHAPPPVRLYPRWLQSHLQRREPRHYLLVRPDLAWEFDPLRESPGQRWRLFAHYQRLLARDRLVHATVGGLGLARIDNARLAVAALLGH